MGNRQFHNFPPPATGEWFPQGRINGRRGNGLDQGDALFEILLEAIGRVGDPRKIQRYFFSGKFVQKAENVGLTAADCPAQSIRQRFTAGVHLNALEINKICGSGQSLLQQWLAGCTFEKGFGLFRQGRQEQLAQQSRQLAVTGRLEFG